jgi:hypothetical protein
LGMIGDGAVANSLFSGGAQHRVTAQTLMPARCCAHAANWAVPMFIADVNA